MSDGNETNNPTTANEPSEPADARAPEPSRIGIVNGNPTDEEVAALVAVLGSAGGGGTPQPGPRERNMWGHPVDKLQYPIFSWQRVTLLERAHLRR